MYKLPTSTGADYGFRAINSISHSENVHLPISECTFRPRDDEVLFSLADGVVAESFGHVKKKNGEYVGLSCGLDYCMTIRRVWNWGEDFQKYI